MLIFSWSLRLHPLFSVNHNFLFLILQLAIKMTTCIMCYAQQLTPILSNVVNIVVTNQHWWHHTAGNSTFGKLSNDYVISQHHNDFLVIIHDLIMQALDPCLMIWDTNVSIKKLHPKSTSIVTQTAHLYHR